MNGPFTRVALVFIAQRVNVYLRFGQPVREHLVGKSRRVVEFAPGSIFCRIRWEANEYGTTLWQLAVLQAMPRSEGMQRVAGIVPGAALLLHAEGAPNVQTALRLIDAIEAQRIDPAEVSARYWPVTHNRLAARAELTPYTFDRHTAQRMAAELK